ncbi:uncharacterized protein MONBRDRAFT_34440 [Monosiga brevicollis MX1]|uniref:Uncharacterized protein n=1 Tax=Monosiga brevicollis TaxID=81824 RepID=A9VBT0_MONBE|nr:uncharacterized protein MONBRDRAFT_34440 [Monosiga brevicollis MX1]EDQ85031.1 predicted protein [Monosiga brevicollis MX1]|eukprot:XP_001750201.1 hypothetical protein [Monosiga brevicollis MX1]
MAGGKATKSGRTAAVGRLDAAALKLLRRLAERYAAEFAVTEQKTRQILRALLDKLPDTSALKRKILANETQALRHFAGFLKDCRNQNAQSEFLASPQTCARACHSLAAQASNLPDWERVMLAAVLKRDEYRAIADTLTQKLVTRSPPPTAAEAARWMALCHKCMVVGASIKTIEANLQLYLRAFAMAADTASKPEELTAWRQLADHTTRFHLALLRSAHLTQSLGDVLAAMYAHHLDMQLRMHAEEPVDVSRAVAQLTVLSRGDVRVALDAALQVTVYEPAETRPVLLGLLQAVLDLAQRNLLRHADTSGAQALAYRVVLVLRQLRVLDEAVALSRVRSLALKTRHMAVAFLQEARPALVADLEANSRDVVLFIVHSEDEEFQQFVDLACSPVDGDENEDEAQATGEMDAPLFILDTAGTTVVTRSG